MHELSIALEIMDVVLAEAERHEGRVTAIHVRLGPLSGVVKEALVSAYELAREGSTLADARLLVEEVPIVVHCPTCAAERPVESIQQLCCAVCQTPTPQVIRGREMDIVALELETSHAAPVD